MLAEHFLVQLQKCSIIIDQQDLGGSCHNPLSDTASLQHYGAVVAAFAPNRRALEVARDVLFTSTRMLGVIKKLFSRKPAESADASAISLSLEQQGRGNLEEFKAPAAGESSVKIEPMAE